MSGGFCTECSFHVDSFDDLTCCPNCKSKSIPCGDENQINLSINWQELRVLVMWAENYARKNDLTKVVYAISNRIEKQFPDRANDSPLTLAKEIGQLADAFDGVQVSDPKLRTDVANQTGHELKPMDIKKKRDL